MTKTMAFSELNARVTEAESAYAQGDCRGAFDLFAEVFARSLHGAGGVLELGYNECLAMQRFADLAVELGETRIALDVYTAYAGSEAPYWMKALAAFKRLQTAVDTGRAMEAKQALRAIAQSVWRSEPPADAVGLEAWEMRIDHFDAERPAVLAQMYLALGKAYNALRKVRLSTACLARGLVYASDTRGQIAEIPLLLAVANNELCTGALAACEATLDKAVRLIATRPAGGAFRVVHGLAAAKLAVVQGRLGDALSLLAATEQAARERGLLRARCACLASLAETMMLLNMFPEADAFLAASAAIAEQAKFGDVQNALARLAAFLSWRSRLIDRMTPDGPVGGMQGEGVSCNGKPRAPLKPVQEDAVVWSGDYLRDYELREFQVYAALEQRPAHAESGVADLRSEFGNSESRLIRARLRTLSGIVLHRKGRNQEAARDLDAARSELSVIGAKRELLQAVPYLASAVRETDPARYAALFRENDDLIESLAATLTVEQRNAFTLSRYTLAEDALRLAIEDVVRAREESVRGPIWRRAWRLLKYGVKANNLVLSLDQERVRRQRVFSGEAHERKQPGVGALLARLAFHPRENQTVGFVLLPNMLFTFGIRRWRLECDITHMDRAAFAANVHALHGALAGGRSRVAELEWSAEWLTEKTGLARILEHAPPRIDSLTVVADGVLHLVPYSLLQCQRGSGVPLVDRFAINVDSVTHRSPFVSGRERNAVLALYRGTRDPLEHARAATDHAAGVLASQYGARCDEAGGRDALKAALNGASFFHYIGHGQSSGVDPDRTGIDLSGPAGEDLMSLRDLDTVDCSRLEQAVILACYGGDAVALPGRWVVSLPEALLRRGANSVLSALWAIEEETAVKLSKDFLEQSCRVGRAKALQHFQQGVKSSMPHPYYWAAFQVHGDAGRLR
jgi:hypothetical protein